MKIFLLFLCLVANSYCLIKKVEYNTMTSLNTTNTSAYFYMETKDFRESVFIFLYFIDDNFNLNKDKLKYCFTTILPDEEISCNFDDLGGPFASINRSNKNHYFYKISYRNDGYLIIGYNGTNSNGSLKVQGASDNLYDIMEDVTDTALSILKIIGIVIGSCLGFVCLVCIILICIGLIKETTKSKTIENTQPSSTEEDNDQKLYPLEPQ